MRSQSAVRSAREIQAGRLATVLICLVYTVGLATASVGCDLAQSSCPAVEPDSAPAASTMGSITARVQIAGLPGAVAAPGSPTPAPQVLGPAAGATIQIIDPQAPDTLVTEQISDARGEASFQVVSGTYWVVVPWSDHVAGLAAAPTVAAFLPNGQAVLAWQEVTILDGAFDVMLTIV